VQALKVAFKIPAVSKRKLLSLTTPEDPPRIFRLPNCITCRWELGVSVHVDETIPCEHKNRLLVLLSNSEIRRRMCLASKNASALQRTLKTLKNSAHIVFTHMSTMFWYASISPGEEQRVVAREHLRW